MNLLCKLKFAPSNVVRMKREVIQGEIKLYKSEL